MTAFAASPAPQSRWLSLARTAWFIVVSLAVGLYVFNIPLQLAEYQVVCSGAGCANGQLNPGDFALLQHTGLSLRFYAGYLAAANTTFVLVFLATAGLIFWRKSNDWFGIFVSAALVLFGVSFVASQPTPLVVRYPVLLVPSQFIDIAGNTGFAILFYLFPDGRLVPRWTRWLVPLVIARETLNVIRPDLLGSDWLFFGEVLSLLGAQVYRYWRVSNAVQRQQTKWVVFGSAIGSLGFLGVIIVFSNILPKGSLGPADYPIGITAIDMAMLLVPLSITVAILRSHLWDIDVLIRRTLIYGALTALLALIYLGVVVALQALFTLLTGQQRSELVTVLSTLVIAALFIPVRSRLQGAIDRRFYRRKYSAARTLAEFGAALRGDTAADLDDLSAHLLAAVDETMQPETVALWLVKR